MKIGLALSGGGVRAAVFHCGVLQRLAVGGLLEQTRFLSTVSGGSLLIGLVFSQNQHRWPTSDDYLSKVLPCVRDCLTSATLQWSYSWRSLALPWRMMYGRAHILATQLEKQWGVSGSFKEVPETPRWIVNCTCFETGKNWRFSKPRMGDYQTHYVLDPDFPIADAIAASAAVPGLIGPLVVRTREYQWHRYENDALVSTQPMAGRYELWDGGVYDNLGVEPLFKPAGGLRSGFDFLIVSDASAPLDFDPRCVKRVLKPGHRVLRLVDVATDQVRGLRARALISEFSRAPASGVYFRIGNTVDTIYSAAKQHAPAGEYLPLEDTQTAAGFPTTLRRLLAAEFEILCRHGYEVADATLASRQSDRFTPETRPVTH